MPIPMPAEVPFFTFITALFTALEFGQVLAPHLCKIRTKPLRAKFETVATNVKHFPPGVRKPPRGNGRVVGKLYVGGRGGFGFLRPGAGRRPHSAADSRASGITEPSRAGVGPNNRVNSRAGRTTVTSRRREAYGAAIVADGLGKFRTRTSKVRNRLTYHQ